MPSVDFADAAFDASLNDFIANALTKDLECSAGTDENDVQQVNMAEKNNMQQFMTNFFIGVCLVLIVIACSDFIKTMIMSRSESLKAGIAYLSIVFIWMCVMDIIYSTVNKDQYFLIWGIIMLLIPIGLSAKFSFGGDITNTDKFDFPDFIEFFKFGDRLTLGSNGNLILWIALAIAFTAIALGVGCGFKYTDVIQSDGKTSESTVRFAVFLSFSLAFLVMAILSFFLMQK